MSSRGHSGLELALDYRSQLSPDLASRLREIPIQVSYLLYPVRAAFSPYVLGGLGWYANKLDVMAGDQVVSHKGSMWTTGVTVYF